MKPLYLTLAALTALTACQSGGSDGVLGSVAGQKSESKAAYGTPDAAAPAKKSYRGVVGENPNAKRAMKNTRTKLSSYCPGVRIREGTNIYRVYPKNAEGDEAIRYQATIARTARECEYDGENLKMRVGVRGRIINGPGGETGSFPMPIRVAVVEGKRTLYSKLHTPKGAIAKGTSNAAFSYVDEQVVIPAPKRTNVRVYVGFDEGPKKGR